MSERRKKAPGGRAQRIVSDLAKRGETRAKDLQKAARELAERSARSRRELAGLIQKEIRRQIRSLGLATRDDIERLQRRLRDLEKGTTAKRPASRTQSSRRTKKTPEH
jgi:polyhydroxyalkanoate synthesis regulator phasin